MTEPKQSTGPTKPPTKVATAFQSFAAAVIAAGGEWIEMEMPTQSMSPGTSIERHIGHTVAEVRVINGIAYGRMRK